MHPGADTADAADHARHLFGRHAFDEFFEPAQRHVAELGVGHVAAVIQGDADTGMPFDAGEGLDRYGSGHIVSLLIPGVRVVDKNNRKEKV
jgi:hypothetical protein